MIVRHRSATRRRVQPAVANSHRNVIRRLGARRAGPPLPDDVSSPVRRPPPSRPCGAAGQTLHFSNVHLNGLKSTVLNTRFDSYRHYNYQDYKYGHVVPTDHICILKEVRKLCRCCCVYSYVSVEFGFVYFSFAFLSFFLHLALLELISF